MTPEELTRHFTDLKRRVEDLERKKIYQQDLAPDSVKQEHMGEGPRFIRSGLYENIPDEELASRSVPIYYVSDYDLLKVYDTDEAQWHTMAGITGVVLSTTTVADTVTETSVFTNSLPAKTISSGEVIVTSLFGRYSTANASDTFDMDFNIGGTNVLTMTSSAANATNLPIYVEFVMTVRSKGVNGTVWPFAIGTFGDEVKTVTATAVTALDTTQARDINVTVQWDVADASNSVSIDQGWVRINN